MIIAFSGNDGSGKSTQIQMFTKKLSDNGLNYALYEEFSYFLLSPLLKLLGSRRKNPATISSQKRKKSQLMKIWPFLVYLDSLIRLLFIKTFKRDEIVVFDRYIYDHLISFEYLGVGSKLLRILVDRFPKPELQFILTAPPKVAMQRKRSDEEAKKYADIDFYKQQTKRYEALAQRLGLKMIITNEDKNKTALKIQMMFTQKLKHRTIKVKPPGEAFKSALKMIKKLDKGGQGKNRTDYRIIKTIESGFLQDSSDIDVIVKPGQYPKALSLLSENAISVTHQEAHKAATIRYKEASEIDLHQDLVWIGAKPFDTSALWKEMPRHLDFYGYTLKLPSPTLQLLITAGHSALQHHYTDATDYQLLRAIINTGKVDWNIVQETAKKFGWDEQLKLIVGFVRAKAFIFGEELPKDTPGWNKKFALKEIKKQVFFHPIRTIKARNTEQIRDVFLFLPRKIRYYITGILTYG